MRREVQDLIGIVDQIQCFCSAHTQTTFTSPTLRTLEQANQQCNDDLKVILEKLKDHEARKIKAILLNIRDEEFDRMRLKLASYIRTFTLLLTLLNG